MQQWILQLLLAFLTPEKLAELIKMGLDAILHFVKRLALDSQNQLDDAFVAKLEEAFAIFFGSVKEKI